ncbi:MAG: inositol monophosphatase family protein [Actinomycetota bacterium]
MTPEALLELFADTAAAVQDAVASIERVALRNRTDRPGQYALDLVADAAACAVLAKAPVRIVSEESGAHEGDSEITVVIDPVDGSTNCARGISYWATSLCALDADGPLAALVVNHATGTCATATRGGGAFRDGIALAVSTVTRLEDSVVAVGGMPPHALPWKQCRILGSIALELVDVASGGFDAHVDPGAWMAPWDYLGGLLICREAGGIVRDADDHELVTDAIDARRQVVAAGTAELADALERAARAW